MTERDNLFHNEIKGFLPSGGGVSPAGGNPLFIRSWKQIFNLLHYDNRLVI